MIAKKIDNFEKLNVDVNYKSDDSNNYSLVAYCKFGRAITHLGKTPTQKMQEHYNASKLNVRFWRETRIGIKNKIMLQQEECQ